MHTILVIGAGKTSTFLIEYLLQHSVKQQWKVIVADANKEAILDKTGEHPNSEAREIDINDTITRGNLIKGSDIVISLLPPSLHILAARDCLTYRKHLITSSYISDEMKELDNAVRDAGLMFMCECGLDPGIDHMSASKIIHSIHRVTGEVRAFKSFTGGLIAPESDTNPWHYKFTWNPKNVVLAGSSGGRYIHNGKIVDVPYASLFDNPKKIGKIEGLPAFEYYPNRDSVSYLPKFDLPDIRTFIRGTLRYPGFMEAWNILVQLGLTNDQEIVKEKTFKDWVANRNSFSSSKPLDEQIAQKLDIEPDSPAMKKVIWLGILEDNPININKGTSAEILLSVLQEKWALSPEDKDLVVMRHEIEYVHRSGKATKLVSDMSLTGTDQKYSAMAKTVGLPMAMLARLVISGKINPPKGVCIPNMQQVYKPILAELEEHGVVFNEKVN